MNNNAVVMIIIIIIIMIIIISNVVCVCLYTINKTLFTLNNANN